MADYLTIIHMCQDFKAWKAAFDADAENRKAAGLMDVSVHRGKDRPNGIALMFAVSDLAKAEVVVKSDTLRETMRAAGVIMEAAAGVGAPHIRFRQGDYAHTDAETYLSVVCRISGIDRFRKGFAMDKADREAAGMTDLGILQARNDPDELLLFWAIRDETKAKALLTSPAMARRQQDVCGVVSDPIVRLWTK